ncbi:hypothetical protein ACUSIJ_28365 [Pseudochelatococcus sp. B33]
MAISFGRFVATHAIIIAAFNAGINASYTWWLWSPRDTLPLSGADNIGIDLVATPAVIAVLSALLGTVFIRQKLRDGRVAMPGMTLPAAFHAAPYGLLARTAAFGLVAAVMLSLPLWTMLQASGIHALLLAEALLSKVAITVVFSLLIVPLVILAALADVQREHGTVAAA